MAWIEFWKKKKKSQTLNWVDKVLLTVFTFELKQAPFAIINHYFVPEW